MQTSAILTWATIVLLVVSAAWYSWRVWNKIDVPVPATFILMTVVLGISYAMYWDKPNASWTGNPGNLSGLVNVIIMTATIIARYAIDGTLAVSFNKLQKTCLAAGGVIVIGWLLTDNPTAGYLMMQALAVVAYVPTVVRLVKEKNPKDSNILWGSILIAAIIAVPPTWEKGDLLGKVYLFRVIPSNLIVVFLVWSKRRAQQVAINPVT